MNFRTALELWAGEMVAGIDFSKDVRAGIGRKVRLTLEQIAGKRRAMEKGVGELLREERAIRSEILNMEPVNWKRVDFLGVQRSGLRERERGLASERRALLERGNKEIDLLHGILLHYVNQLLILGKKPGEQAGGESGSQEAGREAQADYSRRG